VVVAVLPSVFADNRCSVFAVSLQCFKSYTKMNRRDCDSDTTFLPRVACGGLPTSPTYATPGIRRYAALAARYAAMVGTDG